MELINKNTQFIKYPVVLCLGTFDGLHLGHRKLINKSEEIAKENGYKKVAYSFDNIPANFFLHEKANKKLFTHDEKIEEFRGSGVDYLWLDKFDEEIAVVSPHDYILYLKKVLNIKHIIIGFNYSFGQYAKGHSDDLVRYGKTFGFEVSVIVPVKIDGVTVSSTVIRNYIADGHIEKANKMLKNPFFISGVVVRGDQNGRKIEFPTINLLQEEGKLIPKFGVYATNTIIDGKKHKSITNVGVRPTIDESKRVTVETNIFDFDEVCYDLNAKVIFNSYIRSEKKFLNLEELKKQIEKDIEIAKR